VLPLEFAPARTDSLRILCLGAHSDDIEIGCGGTVLHLLEQWPQSEVWWIVFSAGDEREREARASAGEFLADAAGSHVTVHDFRDGYFPYDGGRIKDEFEKLKLAVDPDVVLTHHLDDAHQDHRLVAELTWNTFRSHFVLAYEIPKYDGDLGRPNAYVPLTKEHCDRKVDALMRHFPSQHARAWFEPETFRALLRLRGLEASAPEGYAEAFYARKVILGGGGSR
jgi:LmbE family N-acetylglucosaminyl deacetylase